MYSGELVGSVVEGKEWYLFGVSVKQVYRFGIRGEIDDGPIFLGGRARQIDRDAVLRWRGLIMEGR